MIAPSIFCDVNGDYRGADGQIHKGEGHTTYTTYSLWDTYRAAMPLMSIIQKERMTDIVNTMINICDEQGRLPVWHLWGNGVRSCRMTGRRARGCSSSLPILHGLSARKTSPRV